jgi:hypothetical protein
LPAIALIRAALQLAITALPFPGDKSVVNEPLPAFLFSEGVAINKDAAAWPLRL